MSGRLAKLVAVVATVAHIWVALIAAPWHQLEAHVLPVATSTQGGKSQASSHRCACHHHKHCATPANSDRSSDPSSSAPLAPEHQDDCSICQMLAQPFAQFEHCPIVVICEYAEFTAPAELPLPLSGFLTEPVSRGPPLV